MDKKNDINQLISICKSVKRLSSFQPRPFPFCARTRLSLCSLLVQASMKV